MIIFFASCHFDVEVTKKYEQYFDEASYNAVRKGIDAYEKADYKLADSLLSYTIEKSNDKLSSTMPFEYNPYYYRGQNDIEIEKYEQAIDDFAHVTTDTTTNTSILVALTEAYKMLDKYDAAINACNKLLRLKYDSTLILMQRGLCYYSKKQMDSACADLNASKSLGGDTSYLNNFLKDCK